MVSVQGVRGRIIAEIVLLAGIFTIYHSNNIIYLSIYQSIFRNDKSHQICKMRRCDRLTEKKVSVRCENNEKFRTGNAGEGTGRTKYFYNLKISVHPTLTQKPSKHKLYLTRIV